MSCSMAVGALSKATRMRAFAKHAVLVAIRCNISSFYGPLRRHGIKDPL
jgi:hypothetical protein